MMYWNDGHMSAGWGIAMVLGMSTFLLLLAAGIVWFVRSSRTGRAPTSSSLAVAEQVLAERLARGEIEPDEYRTRLTAIKEPGRADVADAESPRT